MDRFDPCINDLKFGHLCCVSAVAFAISLSVIALLT